MGRTFGLLLGHEQRAVQLRMGARPRRQGLLGQQHGALARNRVVQVLPNVRGAQSRAERGNVCGALGFRAVWAS